MAKTKEKGSFNVGLYSAFAAIFVAVALVILTIVAFTTRYTAFKPDKVAQAYVDTVIQTGDGYNASKNTLISKNQKFGNFVIDAYMAPYINDEVEQAEFVGKGTEEEQKAIDEVYNQMLHFYISLVETYGYDNYDKIYSEYFEKLAMTRNEVYGDEYMDTEYMFGAFEANVAEYGNMLTGTQRTFASDNKTITQEQSTGKYQKLYGEKQEVEVEKLIDDKKQTVKELQPVYKLTTTVKSCDELSADDTKTYIADYKERITSVVEAGKKKADASKLNDDRKNAMISAYEKLDSSDDIKAVAKCIVEVKTQNDKLVATQEIYVVKIGNSWYVDNTNIDTSALYIGVK